MDSTRGRGRKRHTHRSLRLSDVRQVLERRGSTPTGLTRHRLLFHPRWLYFYDPALEAEFLDLVLYKASHAAALRTNFLLATGAQVFFLLFDMRTDDPDVRNDVMVARSLGLFATLFVALTAKAEFARKHKLKVCLFCVTLVLTSFTWVLWVMGSRFQPDYDYEWSRLSIKISMFAGYVLIGLVATMFATLAVRMPIRFVAPVASVIHVPPIAILFAAFKEIPAVFLVIYVVFLYGNLALQFASLFNSERQLRLGFLQNNDIKEESRATINASRLSRALLLNALPQSVANRLQASTSNAAISDGYRSVGVCFVSLGGLQVLDPRRRLVVLQELICLLDDTCDSVGGVEKLKSTSTTYIALAGCPIEFPNHTQPLAEFALTALDALTTRAAALGVKLEIRAGLHTGPLIAGCLGRRAAFDAWGDTINSCARYCARAPEGTVQLSPAAKEDLENNATVAFRYRDRGMVYLKGKGECQAYLLERADPGSLGMPMTSFDDSSRDEGSVQSGLTTSTLAVPLSEEQQREARLIFQPLQDLMHWRRGFLDKDLEHQYICDHHWPRIARRAPGQILLTLSLSLILTCAQLGVAFDDDTLGIFIGLRLVAAIGIAVCWWRARSAEPEVVPRYLTTAQLLLVVGMCGTLLLDLTMVTGTLLHSEQFLIAFAMVALSGLWLTTTVPIAIGTWLLLVVHQLRYNPEALGTLMFPSTVVLFGAIASQSGHRQQRRRYILTRRLRHQNTLLKVELSRAEGVLQRIWPQSVIDRLRSEARGREHGAGALMESFDSATILTLDVVGFTTIAGRIEPSVLVEFLGRLFEGIDGLVAKHGVEAIKTVGDAYVAAAGVPVPHPTPARSIALLALDIIDLVATFGPIAGMPIEIRVGIGSGPCLAGLMGRKRCAYDIFGPAASTADEMESTGFPGSAQICAETASQIRECADFVLESVPKLGSGAPTYLVKRR